MGRRNWPALCRILLLHRPIYCNECGKCGKFSTYFGHNFSPVTHYGMAMKMRTIIAENNHSVNINTYYEATVTYGGLFFKLWAKCLGQSSWTNPWRSPRAPPEKSAVESMVDLAVKVCSGLCTPRRTSILVGLWNWVRHRAQLEPCWTHVEPRRTWVHQLERTVFGCKSGVCLPYVVCMSAVYQLYVCPMSALYQTYRSAI